MPVSLQIRRAYGAAPIAIRVSPADLHPNEMFLRGLKESARVIATDKAKIGYVRVPSYASHRMQSALEDLMSDGPLKDADALVWDLRGGMGRRAAAISRPLQSARAYDEDHRSQRRDGLRRREMAPPVAALINEGTRSGKEVLAYGFKEYRLGELVGHRTEGAVLAATAFLIGNDGAAPCSRSRTCWSTVSASKGSASRRRSKSHSTNSRYAAGGDPQLDRAVQVLAGVLSLPFSVDGRGCWVRLKMCGHRKRGGISQKNQIGQRRSYRIAAEET